VSDQQRHDYQEQAKKCPTPFLYQALKLMNQCDINYRQSSNKRLLVELTLIEIAQITQPDDADASVGRRPRRLKSLFKQLMQQSQRTTVAPQVAAAETRRTSEPAPSASATPTQTVSSPTASEKTSAPSPAPAMKLGGLGFSWNNLSNQEKKKKINMQIIPGTVAVPKEQANVTDAVFSQTDLEFQWMSMCNRMPQKFSGIATRMKNMNPVITDFPNVEVIVDNDLIKQEMEEIHKSITKTLQIYLHNTQLSLAIRIAERQGRVKILTRREQFELLSQKNPAVEKLRQAFDLELA
jgi:DNA polymerase-3 subunit gamma/tau